MNDMKENIKIGLLAVIAVTMIINTFMGSDGGSTTRTSNSSKVAGATTKSSTGVTPNVTPDANEVKAKPADVTPTGPTTNMEFATLKHDFGSVNQETENTYVFEFTNTGNEPLIIEKAKGSCGCTVPRYPKEPIAPGASAEIEVTYKPGKQKGKQSKTVTVTANTNPKTTQLTISADVQEI